LATLLIWVLMALSFRYSSLASITAAVLAPVVYVLAGDTFWIKNASVAFGIAVMAMFLLYRHAENINRLIKGTESKLGKKAAPPVAAPEHGAHRGHPHHRSGTSAKHTGKHGS